MKNNNKEFDREVENIIENASIRPKNKVKSLAKGHRGELDICKILSGRFRMPFNRVVGSGNRFSQVKGLSDAAKEVTLGDVVPPCEKFKFVIEVKNGYEDKVDFYSLFQGGNKTIDAFIKQALEEQHRANRKPIILYKRARRPWLAMIQIEEFNQDFNPIKTDYYLRYRDWVILSLDELLLRSDSFFFKS